MATNTSDFYSYSKTAGTSKNLQKPLDGGDNNVWGNYVNTDFDTIVAAVNATSNLIADANENELIDFTATGSAVNHIGVTNAASGNPPQIASAGDDTNIDLTLAAKGTGDVNLTPGSTGDVNVPANKGITFASDGNEKIESDDTDLTVNSGGAINLTATSDVVVPADVGVTFGTGEKIEGNNTDLTLTSGGDISLTATSDVNIPSGVGLTFASDNNDKIESNDTDLTINSGGDINLTATSDVNLPAQVGLTFGADTEKIEADASNNVTLDATGDITLGTDQVVIGTGSASGKITSSGTQDLVLDTNAGSNSGTITIKDGVDGDIDITPNGSGEVNISKVDIDAGSITGITDLAVADGGTGVSTHTANSVLIGAGASAITSIAPGDDGQVLTSTGSVWQSEPAAAGGVTGLTTDNTNITITSGDFIIGTAGKGITFGGDPDTRQNSPTVGDRTLYDYETGTWSPVVSDGSHHMTMNSSYDTGYYTKIGNVVTVSGQFRTTSLGSAVGDTYILGLPFTVANDQAAYSGGAAANGSGFDITAGYIVSYYGRMNETTMSLRVWDVQTGASNMQATEWTADGNIIIGFSYRVA